jgi:hypothetical protein
MVFFFFQLDDAHLHVFFSSLLKLSYYVSITSSFFFFFFFKLLQIVQIKDKKTLSYHVSILEKNVSEAKLTIERYPMK